MPFYRKLLYYLLGAGLGVLMVFFFFGDRDIQCSYFPNDRVLSDFRKKELVIAAGKQEGLNLVLRDTSLLPMILLNGDVDFERSNTRNEDTCNTYWIDYTDKERGSFASEWMNCDSALILMNVSRMEPR